VTPAGIALAVLLGGCDAGGRASYFGVPSDAGADAADPADAGDAGAAPPIHFAVFGDYGADSPDEADVALLVASEVPDFIVTTGDNNYPDGRWDTIDRNIGKYYSSYIHPYVGIYGEGAPENRFFPSLGNHDWETPDVAPYRAYFTLPGNERYYELVRWPIHFYVLDGDPHEPDGVRMDSIQAEWLRAKLAESTAPFQFVVVHHPPMSSATEHGSGRHMQWPFAQWGADVVLAGHDHVYEHVVQGGVQYVTTGLGGKSIYGLDARVNGSQTFFHDDFGALFVTADEGWADFRFLTRGRQVIDEFTIPSDPAATVHRTLLPAASVWRYQSYDAAPDADWFEPGFDDSAWPTGAAPLGQGDGYLATRLPGAPSDDVGLTTWFRTSFDAPDADRVRSLTMGIRDDDGAIVWLNGVEIFRDNMPLGDVTPTTRADGEREGSQEASFQPYGVDPARLLATGNVLAIEVHQRDAGSGDLALDVVLDAIVGDALLPRGSTWRFTQDDPPEGWTDPPFDDAAWEEGAAALPPDPGLRSFDPDPPPVRLAARGRFDVDDPADYPAVTLRILRDDGAIVWLNGREVLRTNVPAGDVFPTTLAAFEPGPGYGDVWIETTLRPELFVAGENVIAVQLHQAPGDVEYARFDLELLVP
jgi:hypothetical protein